MYRACRKNEKVTNGTFGKLIDDYRAYRRIQALKHVGGWLHDGIKYLFTKETGIDTNEARRIIEKIIRKLKAKKVNKNDKIFKKIDDLYKALYAIDFWHENHVKQYEQDFTEKAKKLYKQLVKQYKKLVK